MQIIELFIYLFILATEPLNISILKLLLETRGQTYNIVYPIIGIFEDKSGLWISRIGLLFEKLSRRNKIAIIII